MKHLKLKTIFSILALLSFQSLHAQNFITTEPESRTGALKVWSEHTGATPNPIYFGEDIFGINALLKANEPALSGSYARVIGSKQRFEITYTGGYGSQNIGFLNEVVYTGSSSFGFPKYGIYTTATGAGNNTGIFAAGSDYAGFFQGNVHVTGVLSKSSGSFKIDHPQDPENKYLSHSFVESPDMMNIYNGNITTDANGNATVTLPDYFESLNIDFRYQLTVIGEFSQAIIAEEINGNTFKIRTEKPNVKVSWMVTGIRNDPFAQKNRIIPEEEKPKNERGKYLNPDIYGKNETYGLHALLKPEDAEETKK